MASDSPSQKLPDLGSPCTFFLVFLGGAIVALSAFVSGVTRFEDLDAWKLCTEMERLVCSLADEQFRRQDLALHAQIRKSASSPAALIAEGWGRFNPADFANYVRMARGSLNETKNHLYSARYKGLITEPALLSALDVFFRAIGATSALGRYLRSPKADQFLAAIRRRPASDAGP